VGFTGLVLAGAAGAGADSCGGRPAVDVEAIANRITAEEIKKGFNMVASPDAGAAICVCGRFNGTPEL
jgi:hypothetical protein